MPRTLTWLALVGLIASTATRSQDAEPVAELPAALAELLEATDDDDDPIFKQPEVVRAYVSGLPVRVRESLIASVDEGWISGGAHLATLLGPGVKPGKLEQLLADKCVMCHTDPEEQNRRTLFSLDPEARRSPTHMAFGNVVRDVHVETGMGCVACHGGDATANNHTDDMLDRWPSSRKQRTRDRSWIPEFCGDCHADPGFVRRFNADLPTDQLSKYRTSGHGKSLLEGSESKAAQCVSCHGVHGILSAESPASSTNRKRVPETCGACHADVEYMAGVTTLAGEPLPTTQLEEYRKSVHGVAVLEKGDMGAPACHDCHGNHASVPVDVERVTAVCRQCHPTQGELYDASSHAEAFAEHGFAECGSCHGKHDIAHPTDDWIGDEPGTVCQDCHSKEAKDNPRCSETAGHFRSTLAGLTGHLDRLEHQAEEFAESGLDADPILIARSDLVEALLQTRTNVHSFEMDLFDRAAAAGHGAIAEADELIAKGHAELRFRTTGLALSVLIMALLGLAIRLKLRQLEDEQDQ